MSSDDPVRVLGCLDGSKIRHSRGSGNPETFMQISCVYILASRPCGNPHVDVTSNFMQSKWIPAHASEKICSLGSDGLSWPE